MQICQIKDKRNKKSFQKYIALKFFVVFIFQFSFSMKLLYKIDKNKREIKRILKIYSSQDFTIYFSLSFYKNI